MQVQIIIPILNPESEFFTSILPALHKQSSPHSLLLINSGSAISKGDYDMITIEKQQFNHANTRNLALDYNADFYLFMTQDAMPCDNELIENLRRAFDDPDVVVSYARQIPYSDADPIERFARETNYPPQSRVKSREDLPELGIKTFFCSDSCAMYRGDYFRAVEGFQKDLNTNEDMEYAARAIMAGKKITYCAKAAVFHSHRFTLRQLWKRYVEIGIFFANHKWILDIISLYTKAESTGMQQALSELKHLRYAAPRSLVRSVIMSAVKFAAFKYGVNQKNIQNGSV